MFSIPLTSSAIFPWLRIWVLPFICGFLLAIILTGLLVRIAATTGWVAASQQERWSKRVVALFGGLPILQAFSIAAWFVSHERETLLLLLLTWSMAALGLLGDLLGLRPTAKLLCQILLAGIAVYAGILHVLSGNYWVDAGFTIFWIAASSR